MGSCSVLCCPVGSCSVGSCPVGSCSVGSCPMGSCPVGLSCGIVSCGMLSCGDFVFGSSFRVILSAVRPPSHAACGAPLCPAGDGGDGEPAGPEEAAVHRV